jgi:CRISPR-associated RAMP protein (TIGR02581 family)
VTQQPAQPATNTLPSRLQLLNRYLFEGKLEMSTGLHIGGGRASLSHSNSPVVLTPDGLPYIPGSSFKGTLRSTIEKVVGSLPPELGLRSCGLPTKENPNERCPTAHPKLLSDLRSEPSANVEAIMEEARANLCHTCQLFGAPIAAAHITVNDLYLFDGTWSGATQIRDGVAIDRDSETAKGGLKYDFEVVPSTTAFKMRLVLENATREDLHLIAIGLSEFMNGFGGVGGFRSRGLGACMLTELSIRYMDLDRLDAEARKKRLQSYLLRKRDGSEDGLEPYAVEQFFETYIDKLFA